jgi:hypothetical protein
MVRVVNKHKHIPTSNDVYIGRGSIFGNPYSSKNGTKAQFIVASKSEAIASYKKYFDERIRVDEEFKSAVESLRGRDVNLVCFCKPSPCHGDVIKEYLDEVKLDLI